MRHACTVPALAEQIEHAWATEIACYFGRAEEDVFQKIRPWFSHSPGTVRIELMDDSCVEFKYCTFLVNEEKKAIAVFTEHCGNHVFPYHEARIYRDGKLLWEQATFKPTEALLFNVFGKLIAISGGPGAWKAFFPGTNGTIVPADFVIPPEVTEAGLAEYLGDLFHENATPKRNTVKRIGPK